MKNFITTFLILCTLAFIACKNKSVSKQNTPAISTTKTDSTKYATFTIGDKEYKGVVTTKELPPDPTSTKFVITCQQANPKATLEIIFSDKNDAINALSLLPTESTSLMGEGWYKVTFTNENNVVYGSKTSSCGLFSAPTGELTTKDHHLIAKNIILYDERYSEKLMQFSLFF